MYFLSLGLKGLIIDCYCVILWSYLCVIASKLYFYSIRSPSGLYGVRRKLLCELFYTFPSEGGFEEAFHQASGTGEGNGWVSNTGTELLPLTTSPLWSICTYMYSAVYRYQRCSVFLKNQHCIFCSLWLWTPPLCYKEDLLPESLAVLTDWPNIICII